MTHVRGTIHGKLIELSEETGLPEGQEVTVFLQPAAEIADRQPLSPGEGLRRAYGRWAEDAEGLDDYIEWNARQRELGRLGAIEEVADLLASGPSPEELLEFRPSPQSQARAVRLLGKLKDGSLSAEERAELEQFEQVERLMRLVKARIRTARV